MILLEMLIMALFQYIAIASAHSLDATQGKNSSIAWGPCSSPSLSRRNGECGFLAVPLDYSKPDGEKIQIAVSRIKSNTSTNKYQGIMLVNPGGPGGSGLTLAVLGSYVPDGVGQTYDWIGFDPRGVGDSKPALSCDPNFLAGPRPDYVPGSFRKEKAWLKRSRAYAKACEKNNGKILQHLTTIDIVKDIESIRIALGEEKINYYGFSYGTYLGQVYATLYPDRVRRMVLDSNVDARRIWFDANLDQGTSFDRVFQIWFEWLARYNDTFKLGDEACEVENTWNQVMEDLTRNPINGTVGSSEWFDAFIAVGYTQSVWIDYGQAFSDWVHKRDADQIIQMYLDANNPGDDNGYAVYLAVESTDLQWPRSSNFIRLKNWFTYSKAPMMTWSNAWYNGPAQFWSAPAGTPVKVDGGNVGQILLIGGTLDAATSFEGSLEVRRRFPRSRLIAITGDTTHADSLNGNDCVDSRVAAYLATGALPARRSGDRPDLACETLPQPNPRSEKSAARADTRELLCVKQILHCKNH